MSLNPRLSANYYYTLVEYNPFRFTVSICNGGRNALLGCYPGCPHSASLARLPNICMGTRILYHGNEKRIILDEISCIIRR